MDGRFCVLGVVSIAETSRVCWVLDICVSRRILVRMHAPAIVQVVGHRRTGRAQSISFLHIASLTVPYVFAWWPVIKLEWLLLRSGNTETALEIRKPHSNFLTTSPRIAHLLVDRKTWSAYLWRGGLLFFFLLLFLHVHETLRRQFVQVACKRFWLLYTRDQRW